MDGVTGAEEGAPLIVGIALERQLIESRVDLFCVLGLGVTLDDFLNPRDHHHQFAADD
jgi:hypothetical protein